MGFNIKKALKRFTPQGQMYSAFRAATGHKGALNDLVGGGLGPTGMVAGEAMDKQRARQLAAQGMTANSAAGGTVNKALPGGMSNFYDDSWKLLAQNPGANPEDALNNILANFKGKPGDLENFLREAQPFLGAGAATALRKSPAMGFLEDQNNWDLGATAGYGAGAAQIARSGGAATRAAQQRLSSMGLGRSSAKAAIQQQGMANVGAQQGDLWANTFQQAQQNRWQSAMGLIDTHRMISQMALGQQITPRESGSGGGNLQSGLAAAGGIGQLLAGIGGLAGGKVA